MLRGLISLGQADNVAAAMASLHLWFAAWTKPGQSPFLGALEKMCHGILNRNTALVFRQSVRMQLSLDVQPSIWPQVEHYARPPG